MAYDLTSDDGLAHSNNSVFIALWNDISQDIKNKENRWIVEMKALGAVIVTPDDGWVDRVNHTISPPDYARLNLGAKVGDLIALGTPDKWRLVRCIEIKRACVSRSLIYHFDPNPVKSFRKVYE